MTRAFPSQHKYEQMKVDPDWSWRRRRRWGGSYLVAAFHSIQTCLNSLIHYLEIHKTPSCTSDLVATVTKAHCNTISNL